MSDVKFIYFDLGNVILNFSHPAMVRQVAEVTGLDLETVQQHLFDSGLENRYETGELNSQQFFDSFAETIKTHHDKSIACDLAAFIEACGDIFWLNGPTVAVISQLWTAGMPLGILSNTCEAHWNVARRKFPLIDQFFDTKITSYHCYSMKPDPKIYHDAIEASGFAAGEIFFTDDKPENVAAAIDVGMDAVVFQSAAGLMRELRSRDINVG